MLLALSMGRPMKKATSGSKAKAKQAQCVLHCKVCAEPAAKARWGETTTDSDGNIVPMEELCWDCKQDFQSRADDFEEVSDYCEWALSDEGQRVLAGESAKKTRKVEPTMVPQDIGAQQQQGLRIYRDMWVANSTVFKLLMGREPNVKMPRTVQCWIPTEDGTDMEQVTCWVVASKIYPLRKMPTFTELSSHRARRELAAMRWKRR